MKERLIFSDAIERVGQMLKSYPPSDAADSSGYLGALAATLLQYPTCVALRCADPIKGVVSTTRFKPTVADLTVWCERELASLRTIVDRDDAAREVAAQRAKAEEHERDVLEQRKHRPSLDELRAKHGPNWGISRGDDHRISENAAVRLAHDDAEKTKKILAEYRRIGREPVYAGDMLVSPELAAMLDPHRSEAE